jgi:hypothetical protein
VVAATAQSGTDTLLMSGDMNNADRSPNIVSRSESLKRVLLHDADEVERLGLPAHGRHHRELVPEREELLVQDPAGVDHLLVDVDIGAHGDHRFEM